MTTTSDTTTEAAPSNAPLFYTRPVPLQADVHADLRILPGRLEFAAGNNAIPLVLGEFSLALHHFPILFAGPTAVPMAAVGVSDQNLFIKDGLWEDEAYIPAYLRRHPFIFIDTGSDNDSCWASTKRARAWSRAVTKASRCSSMARPPTWCSRRWSSVASSPVSTNRPRPSPRP